MRKVQSKYISLPVKISVISLVSLILLIISAWLAISMGSSGSSFSETFAVLKGQAGPDSVASTIVWDIRFPRVVLAGIVGATLALGGLVFQALLRNPLAEPYILGVSGGSAIGAILAMMAGLAPFPGVALAAFVGSMLTLSLVLFIASGRAMINRNSLLLGGVMMNAFCSAVIMFLISLSGNSEIRHILFWLMGDLSSFTGNELPVMGLVLPCFVFIFVMGRPMNLLLMGRENAAAMGVNVRFATVSLLLTTTFMVSIAVCHSGLIGFVGLVLPHILRLVIGADHRLLVPASIFGGSSFLIICDLLARVLPAEGEMPVGIVTALIGAPVFIFLLWRSAR